MATRTSAATASDSGSRKIAPEFFSRQDGSSLPHIEDSSPYILAHNPKRYMVMSGRLVPSPSRVPLVDAADRVRVAPDGRIHFADKAAKLQDSGFCLIPYELGPGGESYIQEIDTRPNGGKNTARAVISVWERAYPGETKTVTDEDGYALWLDELVQKGHLPACPPHVAQRMLDTASGALRDAEEKRAAGKLSDLTRIDALKNEIAVLEKAAGKGAPATGARTAPALNLDAPASKSGKASKAPKNEAADDGANGGAAGGAS